MLGGVETTLPAHLVSASQWRTQHNMRLTPSLEQVPRKKLYATVGSETIRDIATIPSLKPGFGKVLLFTPTAVKLLSGSSLTSGLNDDTIFRKWSIELYNEYIFFCNELNGVCQTDGATCFSLGSEAPKARYLKICYDKMWVGYQAGFPHRLACSDLYNFSKWNPDATNEADYYDFVEWQQTDYPFIGVTGIGKLKGTLFVYTPTAIIPVRYVGKPKVIQVIDDGVVTRIGNTHPWALACLDNVHFFYDGIEQQFWVFDGAQPMPIGESVRKYVANTINPDPEIASRMWSYVDVNNREVWWVFCSTAGSSFDKAVVFNYRLKRWFTASVENIHSFCGPIFIVSTIGELAGTIGALSGTIGNLGVGSTQIPRLFGSTVGKIFREEVAADTTASLESQEDPVLETGDLHYGDITRKKENDAVSINATWNTTTDPGMKLEVRVSGREYLSEDVDWTAAATKADNWVMNKTEKWLNYPAKSGKILRYRFKGTNARNLKFSAFEDMVNLPEVQERAEK